MTLMIVAGALALVSIGFFVWAAKDRNYHGDWREVTGITISILAGAVLLIHLIAWIPSEKDSEIKYQQYIQEKQTIEIMLDSDADVDRLLLNQKVIDYNNRIIADRENS